MKSIVRKTIVFSSAISTFLSVVSVFANQANDILTARQEQLEERKMEDRLGNLQMIQPNRGDTKATDSTKPEISYPAGFYVETATTKGFYFNVDHMLFFMPSENAMFATQNDTDLYEKVKSSAGLNLPPEKQITRLTYVSNVTLFPHGDVISASGQENLLDQTNYKTICDISSELSTKRFALFLKKLEASNILSEYRRRSMDGSNIFSEFQGRSIMNDMMTLETPGESIRRIREYEKIFDLEEMKMIRRYKHLNPQQRRILLLRELTEKMKANP